VASVVVGGVKARPMKWKSPIFVAPGKEISEEGRKGEDQKVQEKN
jgi:hypothetical protein